MSLYENRKMSEEGALMPFAEIMLPDGLGGVHYKKVEATDPENGKKIPGRFWLKWVEKDTVTGVCKKNYRVIQPSELVGGFFDPIVDRQEAVYRSAGVLRGGSTFWALAELTDPRFHIDLFDGVKVLPYVFLGGFADGLRADFATYTSIVVQCQNTFDAALSIAIGDDEIPLVAFRHNATAKEQIAKGHELLNLASKRTQALKRIMEKMGTKKVAGVQVNSLIEHLLPSVRQFKGKNVQANIQTEREKVQAAFDDPLNFTPDTRLTYLNLYNAVTFWIDHNRAEAKRDGQTVERMYSALLGSGKDLRQQAMLWILNQMDQEANE